MKKILASLLLCTALIAPGVAMAKDATITATLNSYSGHEAYLAVYVTKPDGGYDSTLYVAGTKTKYLGDLRGWVSAVQSSGATLSLDGITGASVGSGQTMTINVSLADAMVDAGYQIHVESAVEHGGEYPDDVVVPITSGSQQVNGTGYVQTLFVTM
jgi:hypothetical protein